VSIASRPTLTGENKCKKNTFARLIHYTFVNRRDRQADTASPVKHGFDASARPRRECLDRNAHTLVFGHEILLFLL
jgi:hypothetical protein